jgi:RNA polymerase sigma-70 factor (ECF subfamily)
LRLADLALACACSAGNSAAWDHFVAQYRPELYRAARAIAGESGARELADSLYAELFGLREKGGQRKSLFDYFHGRSKLGTWLRAILAQRHVDDFRRTKKTDSLDDTDDGEQQIELAAANTETDPEREKYLVMMQATLAAILDALAPGDRLRLAYYYVEELTLAQIGKLLGEHEATVSRKLERTRREVRQQVETALLKEKKLSEAQLRLCFEYAREQWPFDLTLRLQAGQSRPVSARD